MCEPVEGDSKIHIKCTECNVNRGRFEINKEGLCVSKPNSLFIHELLIALIICIVFISF